MERTGGHKTRTIQFRCRCDQCMHRASLRCTPEEIGAQLLARDAGLFLDLKNAGQRNGFLRPAGGRGLIDIDHAGEVGQTQALVLEKRWKVDLHTVHVARNATKVKYHFAPYANDAKTGAIYAA